MAFCRFGNMYPPAEWMQKNYLMAERPFHVIGRTYFVGNSWCSSHLIDTGAGLILLDTPCFSELPYLIDGITELGFHLRDLKIILISHAHYDHYGAAQALQYLTGAQTMMSAIDTEDMETNIEFFHMMNTKHGRYNECFHVDRRLMDGDVIELGATKIRCVLTPGHTVGAMSHFWEEEESGKRYRIGIYGGAGYAGLSTERLKQGGYPEHLRRDFLNSIRKVWDEPVDVMLGNHPFHNDIHLKQARYCAGDKNAFIDAGEWQRYLTEMREGCERFLRQTDEQNRIELSESQFMKYLNEYRSHPGYQKNPFQHSPFHGTYY